MNKTEQAQQLRIAANIIETGHPWEYSPDGFSWRLSEGACPMYAVSQGWQIRPIFATPPDGKPLHNPDNLTAEQVGLGYRLTRKGEKPTPEAQVWAGLVHSSGMWQKRDDDAQPYYAGSTYRVPLSVPWPEAKPQTTKQVPLEPEDVPPGSWLKLGNGPSALFAIAEVRYASVVVGAYEPACKSYRQLYDGFQINRSIPLTGKWDANAWEPCSKGAPA
jgi:hypothetical protein